MNHKIFLVARQEFTSTLKRRSAQFAIFGLPILSLLILSGINWFAKSQGSDDSSILSSFISDNADVLPTGLVDETGQINHFPPPTNSLFTPYATLDAAQAAYEADEISGYYQIPADYLTTGNVFHYADNVPIDSPNEYMLFTLLADNFLDESVPTALVIAPLQQYEEINLSATDTQAAQSTGAAIGLSMGTAVLFYLTVIGAAGYLLQSLGKEKENRVMEVLLSSLRPIHLLVGKVLGLGGIGLLQMGVWTFLAFVVFQRGNNLFANISLPTLSAGVWSLTIIHFIAGYLVYASLFAGLGAVVPNVKEGSQYTFLLMLPTFLPLWFNSIMFTAPNGPFAIWISLIPLTAPLAMPMRLTLTAVPPWQWMVSLSASVGTAVLFLWAATKFFRSQTLLTGQHFSPKVIWRTLRNI
ncbi:MAG: ABC transporter permease [Anaerolineales bacterium]|nr:ABC transporter permease [Anaerolineales bacterium]